MCADSLLSMLGEQAARPTFGSNQLKLGVNDYNILPPVY